MEKNEIISRVEEILHNKYDAGGIDSELVEDCVDSTLAAINYTHCCTELCECAVGYIYTEYNKDFGLVCKKCQKPFIS